LDFNWEKCTGYSASKSQLSAENKFSRSSSFFPPRGKLVFFNSNLLQLPEHRSIAFLVVLHFSSYTSSCNLGDLFLAIPTTLPTSVLLMCWFHSLIFSVLHSLAMFTLRSWSNKVFPAPLQRFHFRCFQHISDLFSVWSGFRGVARYWSCR